MHAGEAFPLRRHLRCDVGWMGLAGLKGLFWRQVVTPKDADPPIQRSAMWCCKTEEPG